MRFQCSGPRSTPWTYLRPRGTPRTYLGRATTPHHPSGSPRRHRRIRTWRWRRKRARRRLAAWGALLLLGLALGAIYATGFATSGGTTGTTSNPAANNNDRSDNQDTSALAGLITSNRNLTFNWEGRWGAVDSKVMCEGARQ